MSLNQLIDVSMTNQAFEELGRSFQDILMELDLDDHLLKFKQEYLRLYGALEKSVGNEKVLHSKARELNREIIKNASKIDAAIKISDEDEATISRLRGEIQKAWDMVDSSSEKYRVSQNIIKSLSDQISHLNKIINQVNETKALSKDREIKELIEKKNFVEEKKYSVSRQKRLLEEENKAIHRQIGHALTTRASLEEKETILGDKIGRVETEENALDNSIMLTNGNLNEIKRTIERREREVIDLQEKLNRHGLSMEKAQGKLKEAIKANRMLKNIEDVSKKINQIKEKLINENATKTALEKVMRQRKEELTTTTQAYKDLFSKFEVEKKIYVRLIMNRKKMNKKLETLKEGCKGVKTKIRGVEAEIEATKKKWDQDKSKIEQHEKENLKMIKKQEAIQATLDGFKSSLVQATGIQKKLKQKIVGVQEDIDSKYRKIAEVEGDRERYSREAAESQKKYFQCVQTIKIKKKENADLQKRILESIDQLKQRQRDYEAVRLEKNNFSKCLIESSEDQAYLERKFDIVNQQLATLTESGKKNVTILSKFEGSMKKLKESYTRKFISDTDAKNDLEKLKEELQKRDQENKKLNTVIKKTDDKRKDQRKTLQQVTNSRDILGTQLIRRNDEIALLKQKIKIQERILKNGHLQLNEREEEMKKLKRRIRQFQRELLLVRKKISTIHSLKTSCAKSKQLILDEKKKVRGLSEELEDPKKIERWRKIKCKMLSTKEIAKKIQKLQHQIILKTEVLMGKEIEKKQKVKMIQELVTIRKKQPSSDQVKKLNLLQDTLRKQNVRMKTLNSELNLQTFNDQQQKYELERVRRELNEVKKEYFSLKKIISE